jgi:hypothetical protein
MAFRPVEGAEIAGGYRLVEKLGAGGYGEVWRATAPGGLGKAVKIVFGDTTSPQAGQELRALDRIKEVRHPFLLSLERVEVLDGQLLVVMELAEGSLAGRFQECRESGLPGIPRGELLSHLRDAASALDYMAYAHGLQHLDVKPENLLLVGNRIKVADFGLVRGLGATRVTGLAVTPIYATPEAFDGRVSRNSDQYSLAIVYQEMLTGVRPFTGTTLMQLAAQHISGQPRLQPLPPGDRPVIGRALAKSADDRYGSCSEMVEALLAVPTSSTSESSGALVRSDADTALRIAGVSTPRSGSAGITPTIPGTARPIAAPSDCDAACDGGRDGLRETVIPGAAVIAATPAPAATPRQAATGGIRPTLFVGVGGLSGAALCRLKDRLRNQHPHPEVTAIYRCLFVDTDPEALRAARRGRLIGALDVAETLHAPLHSPDHYRQHSRSLLRWLDRRWLYGIPRSLLTEGIRPLGRLAFVDNAAEILDRLREAIRRVTDAAALDAAAGAAGLEVRDAVPRVFVVASITGGTGGGMLVSLVYAIRQVLAELRVSPGGLCGLLLYATGPGPTQREMARVNARATLRELEHWAGDGAAYPGDADAGLRPSDAVAGLFEDTYLVHLGEGLDRETSEATAAVVGDYLAFDASPCGGAFLDRFRADTRAAAGEPPRAAAVRTFGLSPVNPGGADPAQAAATRLHLLLLERWLSEPGSAESVAIRLEAERRVAEFGLDETCIASSVQSALASVTTARPEALIPGLLARSAEHAGSARTASLLSSVDATFVPGTAESQPAGPPLSPALQRAVEEHGSKVIREIVGWLLRLVDTPGSRFKAAERSAAIVQKRVVALQRSARSRLERVSAQRRDLRHRIEARASPPGSGTFRRTAPTAARPSVGGDLTAYCRLWLREITEANTLVLLNLVAGRIDSFREALGTSCARLQSLAAQLRKQTHTPTPPDREVGRTVGGSERPASNPLTSDDRWLANLVAALDQKLTQRALADDADRRAFLTGNEDPFDHRVSRLGVQSDLLDESVLATAKEVIVAARQEPNRAERFLQLHGSAEAARSALLQIVHDARPRLRVEGYPERLFIVVPEGPSGAELAALLSAALPGPPLVLVSPADEMVVCHEAAGFPLPDAGHALLGGQDVPEELVYQVLSRLDVRWSASETPR